MKLSIVTINLNNVIGLRKTIESVVSQTYDNIEYIIIDGGSRDGSLEVIRQYEDVISSWVSEPDMGIYNAMNKGIKAASGDFINFLNSGDLYSGDLVLERIANIISTSSAKLFFGNYLLINSSDGTCKICNIPEVKSKADLLYNIFAHPSTFYNRELFYEVGTFNEKYGIAADFDWYLNALTKLKVMFTQINLYSSLFFEGGISTTNKKQLDSEYKDIIIKYFSPAELKVYSGRTFKYLMNFSVTRELLVMSLNLRLNKEKQ